ncbi:DUF6789 family protein [Halopiger thermotolerans]
MSVSDRLSQLRPSAGSASEGRAADERSRTADKNIPGAVARGVQAGFVATLIMTAFRLPIMRSLPPSANFWSQYVARDHDPDSHPIAGLVLHLAYGIQGGAMFGALFELQDAEQAIEPEQRGLVWGSVYGMVLSALGSQVVLKELLGIQLDADELALFHAGHLIYGLSLGAWVGSRTEGSEHPETDYEYDDGN